MAITSGSRARRNRAQWQALIERGERSPLGIAAFCAGEDISTASYYAWRKRLSRTAPTPGPSESGGLSEAAASFVDLGVLGVGGGAPGNWDIELALGEGVVLRLRRG